MLRPHGHWQDSESSALWSGPASFSGALRPTCSCKPFLMSKPNLLLSLLSPLLPFASSHISNSFPPANLPHTGIHSFLRSALLMVTNNVNLAKPLPNPQACSDSQLGGLLSFLRFYLFLERGEEKERGTKISMCSCLLHASYWELGPQPRHVPWLGIKPATLWFATQAQSTELHQPGPVWWF